MALTVSWLCAVSVYMQWGMSWSSCQEAHSSKKICGPKRSSGLRTLDVEVSTLGCSTVTSPASRAGLHSDGCNSHVLGTAQEVLEVTEMHGVCSLFL